METKTCLLYKNLFIKRTWPVCDMKEVKDDIKMVDNNLRSGEEESNDEDK